MKDSIKWLSVLIAVVVISVAVSWAFFGHSDGKNVGTITSPPTVLDFLQLQQGLGFGLTGQTPLTMQGFRVALPATTGQILCSVANPSTSTSTVTSVTFENTTSTTTSQTIVIGTTTTATATSSSIGTVTIPAGGFQTFSFDGTLNNNIIGPGQFINIGTAAGALTTGVQYGGTCNAVFQSVS